MGKYITYREHQSTQHRSCGKFRSFPQDCLEKLGCQLCNFYLLSLLY
jgi:hypothetical protein